MPRTRWAVLAAVAVSFPLLNCADSSAPETQRAEVTASRAPRKPPLTAVQVSEFDHLAARARTLRDATDRSKVFTPDMRRELEQLTADYKAFAARTGHTELNVREHMRLGADGRLGTDLIKDPGAGGCSPCPRVPDNEPLGYVCILIDDFCDPTWGRICAYSCFPIERIG